MKDHSFSQITRDLGVGYGTQRRFLEREIDEEALGFIQGENEVCIDMKGALRKVAEALFSEAKVVVDHFHVIADSNRRMDEARRIEQDIHQKRKVKIPKKIFLIGVEKLGEKEQQRVDTHGQSPWHFTVQASLDLNPDVLAILRTQ